MMKAMTQNNHWRKPVELPWLKHVKV